MYEHERGWYLTRMFSLKGEIEEVIEESELDDKHIAMTLNALFEEYESEQKLSDCSKCLLEKEANHE